MGIVKIDLGKLGAAVATAAPARSDIQRALRGIGQAAYQKWVRLAQQELKSTSRDYAAGLQMHPGDKTVEITLEGVLPNMIERGWSGGDMREWMLRSPKTKQGKRGPYLVIPFRHGTPGTGGRNVGAAMPKSIHEVAKTLAPTLSRPGVIEGRGGKGDTQWGGRLHPGLPMKAAAKKILQTKKQHWHTTSIYTGMVRKEKTYQNATQSSYQTFRTISMHSNEPGKHWVHPGIKAKRFAPRVQAHAEKIATSLIAAAIGGKP